MDVETTLCAYWEVVDSLLPASEVERTIYCLAKYKQICTEALYSLHEDVLMLLTSNRRLVNVQSKAIEYIDSLNQSSICNDISKAVFLFFATAHNKDIFLFSLCNQLTSVLVN